MRQLVYPLVPLLDKQRLLFDKLLNLFAAIPLGILNIDQFFLIT